jgi:Domain of unknown function DUF11
MSRSALALLVIATTWLLSSPVTARASVDLAVTESASASVVKKGETVTITATVKNLGTEANQRDPKLQLAGVANPHSVAQNPYQSFSAPQGSCSDESEGEHLVLTCELGSIAGGASVQITEVVTMNETMRHSAVLVIGPEGGLDHFEEPGETNTSNNGDEIKVSASAPPVLTGSRKIRLSGLPNGCVSGDFPLKVIVAAKAVKKVVVSLFLGFDQAGTGEWRRVARGPRLHVIVPASRISPSPNLAATYKLKIKARLKGGTRLKRTIEFQLC